ncbi:hypothetical protein NP233_g12243 [Leucocoprinus birnbaumii]|uniref:Uncharacterized protein n=1 Tax=Leucocoprinus birnbaumii TaxID=56174 RepID=A0AAD5VER9_9AGAR|nr:hypothetical protein NP233_g12243 [Leucocoprinus birnbaumii]
MDREKDLTDLKAQKNCAKKALCKQANKEHNKELIKATKKLRKAKVNAITEAGWMVDAPLRCSKQAASPLPANGEKPKKRQKSTQVIHPGNVDTTKTASSQKAMSVPAKSTTSTAASSQKTTKKNSKPKPHNCEASHESSASLSEEEDKEDKEVEDKPEEEYKEEEDDLEEEDNLEGESELEEEAKALFLPEDSDEKNITTGEQEPQTSTNEASALFNNDNNIVNVTSSRNSLPSSQIPSQSPPFKDTTNKGPKAHHTQAKYCKGTKSDEVFSRARQQPEVLEACSSPQKKHLKLVCCSVQADGKMVWPSYLLLSDTGLHPQDLVIKALVKHAISTCEGWLVFEHAFPEIRDRDGFCSQLMLSLADTLVKENPDNDRFVMLQKCVNEDKHFLTTTGNWLQSTSATIAWEMEKNVGSVFRSFWTRTHLCTLAAGRLMRRAMPPRRRYFGASANLVWAWMLWAYQRSPSRED